ncbi:MAG: hypothetical protein IPK24_00180 [Kineosporiaceae bacterium]|nr:hypothetical protein [Kineosporiaceae bacterium]
MKTVIVTKWVPSIDQQQLRRIRLAFSGLELTPSEHARGADWWAAQGDDVDPWLGDLVDCS